MAEAQLAAAVRHILQIAAAEHSSELTDCQLLDAFIARGDEAAFAALVRRHGPMVLGVCRHVLGQRQDAESALRRCPGPS